MIKPKHKFGHWVVIRRAENNFSRQIRWECRCKCGKIKIVSQGNLLSGRSKTCGCSQIIHGMRKTKEYRAWQAMKERCYRKKHQKFKHYGGRGIRICDRWLNSFVKFYFDVGLAPSSKHSIDRIRVNGNYTPGNVRWATKSEQSRNQRKRRVR